MRVINTRRYKKDNGLNAFGDYNALQVHSFWRYNGHHMVKSSARFYLAKTKGPRTTRRCVTKAEFHDLLFNFFLQQHGSRISTL